MSTAIEVSRGALTHPDIHSLDEVNRDVLRPLSRPGRGWWALLAVSIAGIGLLAFLAGRERCRTLLGTGSSGRPDRADRKT